VGYSPLRNRQFVYHAEVLSKLLLYLPTSCDLCIKNSLFLLRPPKTLPTRPRLQTFIEILYTIVILRFTEFNLFKFIYIYIRINIEIVRYNDLSMVIYRIFDG